MHSVNNVIESVVHISTPHRQDRVFGCITNAQRTQTITNAKGKEALLGSWPKGPTLVWERLLQELHPGNWTNKQDLNGQKRLGNEGDGRLNRRGARDTWHPIYRAFMGSGDRSWEEHGAKKVRGPRWICRRPPPGICALLLLLSSVLRGCHSLSPWPPLYLRTLFSSCSKPLPISPIFWVHLDTSFPSLPKRAFSGSWFKTGADGSTVGVSKQTNKKKIMSINRERILGITTHLEGEKSLISVVCDI